MFLMPGHMSINFRIVYDPGGGSGANTYPQQDQSGGIQLLQLAVPAIIRSKTGDDNQGPPHELHSGKTVGFVGTHGSIPKDIRSKAQPEAHKDYGDRNNKFK